MFYRKLKITIAAVIFAVAQSFAQSKQELSIQALPLHEQCASLQSGNDAVPGHITALKEKEAQKRVKAAEALGKSCDARAVEPLIAAVKDQEPAVRIAVVEALGGLGDRGVIELLIDAASGEDWRVRAALVRTLASFQVHQSSNAALNVLTNPGDKTVTEEGDLRARCLGILMINQLRDVRFSRKAIGFLFSFLDSPDPALRRIAEETALELKNTRNGYHELIGILKQHNHPDFRRKAAYWLGRFNLEAARDALAEAATGDRDASVQKVAKEALEGMK
ncbi:MAG: HEAT repeat domain-containing protein [Blastocatellia bacterium]